MTRARLETVAADIAEARRLAAQAAAHLTSATLPGIDAESAYGLCYQAVLKGCIAALLAHGKRVAGTTGGHVVTLAEAARTLGLDQDLADRVDVMRRGRHHVFYDATEVSELELEGARRDARLLLDAVAARLESG